MMEQILYISEMEDITNSKLGKKLKNILTGERTPVAVSYRTAPPFSFIWSLAKKTLKRFD